MHLPLRFRNGGVCLFGRAILNKPYDESHLMYVSAGVLDSIRLYDRALSEAEVLLLHTLPNLLPTLEEPFPVQVRLLYSP